MHFLKKSYLFSVKYDHNLSMPRWIFLQSGTQDRLNKFPGYKNFDGSMREFFMPKLRIYVILYA